jgi:hypothetical protein
VWDFHPRVYIPHAGVEVDLKKRWRQAPQFLNLPPFFWEPLVVPDTFIKYLKAHEVLRK